MSRQERARRVPEAEDGFMDAVLGLAAVCGWRSYHTRDSRRSTEGFPDLVLVKGNRLIAAELKAADGRLTPAQREWLYDLGLVAAFAANVQVFVWRPGDWAEVERQLRSPVPLVPAAGTPVE